MSVASRYAKSVLDLSIEKGQLEAVYQDMLLIKNVCESNREMVVFLNNPVVKTDKKQEVFQAIFKGKLSELSMSFIDLLTRKRREMYINKVAIAFIEQYKTYKKILTAVITSAVGLDDTTRKKVMDLVKSVASGEVELVEKIDKTLIGGFVIKVGDKQVDASISRKLAGLRKSFSENPFISEL